VVEGARDLSVQEEASKEATQKQPQQPFQEVAVNQKVINLYQEVAVNLRIQLLFHHLICSDMIGYGPSLNLKVQSPNISMLSSINTVRFEH